MEKAGLNNLLEALPDLLINKYTAVTFAFVMLVYAFKLLSTKDKAIGFNPGLFCLLMGLGPILILFAVGVFKALFLARYLIFVTPFATMFFVNATLKIHKQGHVLLSLLVITSLGFIKIKKESGMDYKSLVNIIKQKKKPNDIVILNKRDNIVQFEYYYNRENFLKYKNIDSLCVSERIFGLNTTEGLDEIFKSPVDKIYLAQSFHTIHALQNEMKITLVNKYANQLYSTDSLKGIEFTILEKKKSN
ncbi:MAG: hypothetical protein IT236_05040 [Bacteroidia bacterium]|nr:hypothetical protein [Bacteroidia bacterium]